MLALLLRLTLNVACHPTCLDLAPLLPGPDDHGRRAMVAERWLPIQWTLDPLVGLSDRHRLVVVLLNSNPEDLSLPMSGRTKWSGYSGNSLH